MTMLDPTASAPDPMRKAHDGAAPGKPVPFKTAPASPALLAG